jgi:hypothetical protein
MSELSFAHSIEKSLLENIPITGPPLTTNIPEDANFETAIKAEYNLEDNAWKEVCW